MEFDDDEHLHHSENGASVKWELLSSNQRNVERMACSTATPARKLKRLKNTRLLGRRAASADAIRESDLLSAFNTGLSIYSTSSLFSPAASHFTSLVDV
jgi:hypothetical protein